MLYYPHMYNWSVDEKELKKDPTQYTIWRLEQMVNFGLGGSQINKQELKRYWSKLHLDPRKKAFLKILLWPKRHPQSSH